MENKIAIKKSLLLAIIFAFAALLLSGFVLLSSNQKTQNQNICSAISQTGGCGMMQNNNVVTNSANDSQNNKASQVQEVSVRALSTGYYDNEQIIVKKGVPVRFTFTADPLAGCGKYLEISEFNVKLVSKNGEAAVAEFTPEKSGTYYYHCGMWMFKGKLIVE